MPHSLLMCFAHPDDESLFAAGTAHKYAAAGVDVALCCGTRGERGSVGDPPLATQEPDPATLRAQPGVDFVIDTSASREIKARALLAHGTQREGVDRVFLARPDRDAMLSREVFRLGGGEMPPTLPAEDLYAGFS